MSIAVKGPWSLEQTEQFLAESAIPLRLACLRSDGFPQVVSLWFQYRNGTLQCVSHRDSYLIRLLQDNPKVGFEVAPNEPPYYGVRGRGSATLTDLGQEDTLDELLDNYLGGRDSTLAHWLLSRKDEELLITIRPVQLSSWDYRQRMADVAGGQ